MSRTVDHFAPGPPPGGELGITPAQLALARLLHQHPAVVLTPSSRTPAHIDENLDAARIDLHPTRSRPSNTCWLPPCPPEATCGDYGGGTVSSRWVDCSGALVPDSPASSPSTTNLTGPPAVHPGIESGPATPMT
jgi:hypothetical protein